MIPQAAPAVQRGQCRPALVVRRTRAHILALIAPVCGAGAAVSASSHGMARLRWNVHGSPACAAAIGALIARRAIAAGLGRVRLRRGSLRYLGMLRVLADSARLHGMTL
ncbi:50S ribosomal protein L18 [Candidatus Tremblaya princeps]|uniref:50S ribosomal protein L18 n=1 Tax=Tremblaya princeps TaxID=189385 RepID=A0A143WNH0_TREPR|nr:50S ribosomal protein L18 [Candidatus Tremblaya princeps]